MTDQQVKRITKEEASAALRAAAFTESVECPTCGQPREGEGRTIIHSFLGGIGADHDLATALDYVERSDDRAWAPHLFGHELAVAVDGKVYRYDARRPSSFADGTMDPAIAYGKGSFTSGLGT